MNNSHFIIKRKVKIKNKTISVLRFKRWIPTMNLSFLLTHVGVKIYFLLRNDHRAEISPHRVKISFFRNQIVNECESVGGIEREYE